MNCNFTGTLKLFEPVLFLNVIFWCLCALNDPSEIFVYYLVEMAFCAYARSSCDWNSPARTDRWNIRSRIRGTQRKIYPHLTSGHYKYPVALCRHTGVQYLSTQICGSHTAWRVYVCVLIYVTGHACNHGSAYLYSETAYLTPSIPVQPQPPVTTANIYIHIAKPARQYSANHIHIHPEHMIVISARRM